MTSFNNPHQRAAANHRAVHSRAVASFNSRSKTFRGNAAAATAANNASIKRNVDAQRRTSNSSRAAAASSPAAASYGPTPLDRIPSIFRLALWVGAGLILLSVAASEQGQAITADLVEWGEAVYDEHVQPFFASE